MPKTRVNGVEISYEIDGKGFPLIFIHGGFGGPQTTINPGIKFVLDAVPLEQFQVVTYDRRCAGQSEYAMKWFTLEDIATDTRELMTHLGFDRFVVVGSSMGGMVAQQYTVLFPDSVEALALVNTGPDLMSHTPWGKANRETVGRVRATGDDAEFELIRERLRNPPPPPPAMVTADNRAQVEAQRAEYLKRLATVSDAELKRYHSGSIRNFAAFLDYDFTPHLRGFTMPVLILHGNADTVVPFEYAKALKNGIPHSEFCEIDGANHGILGNATARQRMKDWLARLDLGNAP